MTTAIEPSSPSTPEPPPSIVSVEARIAPLRARLAEHPLYRSISTEAQLRVFLESHVFAVWDFMSLLKALQRALTCVAVPWRPSKFPASRRFVNEIVLGEESDEFPTPGGPVPISHFELYLRAMAEAGADTTSIHNLLSDLDSTPVAEAVERAQIPEGARAFLRHTFALIAEGKLHRLAAAFTFGREDLIPDMFRAMVRDLNRENAGNLDTFIWYLERHIEVDGEDHGPLSLRMVADLCGTDEVRWREAGDAAAEALAARLALWDAVLAEVTAAR